MLALAAAWHERVLADEVVSHAFSSRLPPGPHGPTRRLLGRGPRRAGRLHGVVW